MYNIKDQPKSTEQVSEGNIFFKTSILQKLLNHSSKYSES